MSFDVDEPFLAGIEKAVEDAESGTSAEMVVVLARQSGSYRDIDVLGGAGVAALALLTILYIPWEINYHFVTFEVILAGVLGGLACRRLPATRRWLTSSARRARQVDQGAKVAFVDEEVSCTRDRSGVLVYLSGLEAELRILPDQGLLAHVPRAAFNELVHSFHHRPATSSPREGLEELLRKLGSILAGPCPRRGDDRNELSNRPRISACES